MNRRGFFALLAAAIAPHASRALNNQALNSRWNEIKARCLSKFAPANRWGGIKAYWIDEGAGLIESGFINGRQWGEEIRTYWSPPDIRLIDLRLKEMQAPPVKVKGDVAIRVKFDQHRNAFSLKWE